MWRPKGWQKQHPDPCKDCEDKARPGLGDLTSAKFCLEQCTEEDEYDTFEAGADAMLEALKANGLNFTQYPYYMGCIDEFDYLRPFDGKKGWLVFIPEEGE